MFGTLFQGILNKLLENLKLEDFFSELLRSFLDKWLQKKGTAMQVDANDPDFKAAMTEAVNEVCKK